MVKERLTGGRGNKRAVAAKGTRLTRKHKGRFKIEKEFWVMNR